MTTRKSKCPICEKVDSVVRILYGMPAVKAWEDEQAGKLHIGGCCIDNDSPKWYCKRCDKEFGKIDLQ
jgi:hypothetical protein